MKLFGKNKKKDKEETIEIEDTETVKKGKGLFSKKEKEYVPVDVKLFYIMPILLIVGVLCVVVGTTFSVKNKADYNSRRMASSMTYGQPLPLWGGTSAGVLTLGNTLLSQDEKTLAVEIGYDEVAHKNLSSFGNRYKLRLVDTKDNVMDVDMEYGLFGTDGNGVLKIYSEQGFENKAFIVMIIDNGKLVTSDDLSSTSVMSDSEINKSITAQLSQINSNSSTKGSQKEKLPPLYYVRLNAHSSPKSKNNWKTDKELVEDLFVNKNLKQIKASIDDIDKKIEKGKYTLDEMEKRIELNENDNVAINEKRTLENSLENLKQQKGVAQDNFDKIKSSIIDDEVLEPKVKTYEAFTISDINNMN